MKMSWSPNRWPLAMKRSWSPNYWPLAMQLALAFALVSALALAGGGLLLLRQTASRMLAERSASTLTRAQAAATVAAELWDQPEDQLSLSLYRFYQQTGVRPVALDRTGQVIADISQSDALQGQQLSHPEVAVALAGGMQTGTRLLPGGEWVMYGAVPVMRSGEQVGAILVSADIEAIGESLRLLQGQLALAAGVVEAVAILLGFLLARYLSLPVVRLRAAVSQLARGELSARVRPGGSRELHELAGGFNRMAVELGRLDQQRRAFVADASHELRTPIASVRAMAEALLSDRSGNLLAMQEHLADIVRECDRAGRLIHRLLELAQLDLRREAIASAERSNEAGDLWEATDAANAREMNEQWNVREIAEEIVHALEPLAQERGVTLELLPGIAVLAQIDVRMVETVLGNLVENGLKYTLSGGRVQVDVLMEANQAVIKVTDTGLGIAAAELPHIFQRFYRVDKARARATGGAGLGLAIASEAAAIVGGQITVKSEPGKGSQFRFSFPV